MSQSTPAFIAKLSIVIEEADEADFWIDLSMALNLFNNHSNATKVMAEAKELTAIFVSTRKTMNLERGH